MKKFLLLSLMMLVLVSTLWFKTGTANASGAVVVLYLPGVTKQELKTATMFVDSHYEPVYCVLQDADTGRVVCHVAGKYGGRFVQILLGGQVFYATVSNVRANMTEEDQALTCEAGYSPGAYVTFTYSEGSETTTMVIFGSTLDEVAQNASALLGEQYSSFTITSELQCFPDEA